MFDSSHSWFNKMFVTIFDKLTFLNYLNLDMDIKLLLTNYHLKIFYIQVIIIILIMELNYPYIFTQSILLK